MKPGPRPVGAAASTPARLPASDLLFNAFLFLAGVGGIYFRMARDNDDLVRMVLVLVVGAALPAILVTEGVAVPLSLSLPAFGWCAAELYASFATLAPAESLKEFMKIGIYLLLFLTLVSAAARPAPPPSQDPADARRAASRRWIAWLALAAGVAVSWFHAYPTSPWFPQFPIWSTGQVICSLGATLLLGTAFVLFLDRAPVRTAVLRGCWVMAISACVIGLAQFCGPDYDVLRPWDPKQPYNLVLSLPPDLLNIVGAVTNGRLEMAGNDVVLVLHRILGIYGNPDFFAPYLIQFIPLAVAAIALDPARRWRSVILLYALLQTLALTDVAGAWLALLMTAPLMGGLLGYVRGPMAREAVQPRLPWSAALVALAAGLFALSRLQHDMVMPLAYCAVCGVFMEAAYLAIRVFHRHLARVVVVVAAVVLLASVAIGVMLYRTGIKSSAITERIVKSRLAAEMWMEQPLHGVGLNAYKSWYPKLNQQVRLKHNWTFEMLGSSFTQENRTHDDFAQMLAETGALSTGMFLWFMASILLGSLRRFASGPPLPPAEQANVVGLAGGMLVILIYALPNFPFHIVSSAGTFWVIAALLASYQVRPKPAAPRAPAVLEPSAPADGPALPAGGRRRLLLGAVAVTVALTTVLSWKLFMATIYYKRADTAVQHQRPPDVKTGQIFYAKALGLDFSNAQYYYDYGAMCFNGAGTDAAMSADAERLLGGAKTHGFLNEDLEYGLGHLAEARGDFASAYAHFSAATALNERHDPSRQGRLRLLAREMPQAEAAYAKHQWKKSLALYQAALQANPGNWLAAYRIGTIMAVPPFGDAQAALPWLEQAARTSVNESTMWLALGRGYGAAGRFADAARVLRRAAALDPKSQDIQNALTAANASLNQPPPAMPVEGRDYRGPGKPGPVPLHALPAKAPAAAPAPAKPAAAAKPKSAPAAKPAAAPAPAAADGASGDQQEGQSELQVP